MEASQDSPVKQRSKDQREANAGEPVCTICGRYGEYICDQSDRDICSLQCKSILLSNLKNPNPLNLPNTSDECFYVKSNNMLTKSQLNSLRDQMDISVKGENVPDLVVSFSDLNLPEKLGNNIELCGFVGPTPVQMQAIPCALNVRNLLVSSSTGSGKTASYLIPIIYNCIKLRLNRIDESKKPLAIVIAPTRELCVQVEEQARVLAKGLPFKTALCVGGDSISSQIYRFSKGIELIVGTPGRLIDIFEKFETDLSEVSMLVLDEVDCLFQKGFEEQIMKIIKALSNPQILMFSATISNEAEKKANSIANNLIYISCGKNSNELNKVIKQVPIWVETTQKKKKLFEILTSEKHFKPPVIIFVNSRMGADLLSEAIRVKTGLNSISIHGEKTMKERREKLKSFITGEVPVLVSTGVLGRGMDILKLNQVIIFDLPNKIEEYLHQIGRASRRGEEGNVMLFLNWEDKKIFGELVRVLKANGAVLPPQLKGFRDANNEDCGFMKKRKVGF